MSIRRVLAAGIFALLAAFTAPGWAQPAELDDALSFGATPPLGQGPVNLLVNGACERSCIPFMNPDPQDGMIPDDVPAGWISWQSFTDSGVEMSSLQQVVDNGPSRPGSRPVGG